MVPARTREVIIPRDKRSNSSGVAPTNPEIEYFQVDGYSTASLFKMALGSMLLLDLMVISLANTTLSKSPD